MILLSGTPILQDPFELAVVFNLLKPGIFPSVREEFNGYYIHEDLETQMKANLSIARRMSGLLSFYQDKDAELLEVPKFKRYFVFSLLSEK